MTMLARTLQRTLQRAHGRLTAEISHAKAQNAVTSSFVRWNSGASAATNLIGRSTWWRTLAAAAGVSVCAAGVAGVTAEALGEPRYKSQNLGAAGGVFASRKIA